MNEPKKPLFEKYASMQDSHDAWKQFCETEINFSKLRHVNWWFVAKQQFAINNVIESILSKAMKNNDKWYMEALISHLSNIHSDLSDEERLDLESGEHFPKAVKKYESFLSLDFEDKDKHMLATYGISLSQAEEYLYYKSEKMNWFERFINAVASIGFLTIYTMLVATILTVLINIFTIYDFILIPQDYLFSSSELNLIFQTVLRLIVVLITLALTLSALCCAVTLVLFLKPFFELYGISMDIFDAPFIEVAARYLSEVLWLVGYISPIFWVAIIYILIASMQSGTRAFKISKFLT